MIAEELNISLQTLRLISMESYRGEGSLWEDGAYDLHQYYIQRMKGIGADLSTKRAVTNG
jgi:hypothetical protein